MAATEVFKMTNPNSTCTAASLTWVQLRLTHQTPRPDHFTANDHYLNNRMGDINDLDSNPDTQVAIMQLETVVKQTGGSFTSTQIAEVFKNNNPYIGIFWNSFHTMAYSYGHLDKHYFDNNYGLYKAKTTKDILAKMEEIRKTYGEKWKGYVVLKLKPQLRLI